MPRRLGAVVAIMALCLQHACTVAAYDRDNDITRMLINRIVNRKDHQQKPLMRQDVDDPSEIQPVKVIVAGLPRTGTTSFEAAAKRLGLKTYNMQKMSKTTGHTKVWHDYYVKGKYENLEILIDSIAANGYNATAGATMFHYDYLMQAYPDALVIQTIRSEDDPGAAWTRSVSNSIMSLLPVIKEPPFCWLSFPRTMFDMISTLLNAQFAPMDETTGLPNMTYMPQHYDDWGKRIQSTVPQEKLLVFRAKDGWKPLCDFLSPTSPIIAANCKDILASGEPYPRVNDTANFQAAVAFCRWVQFVCFEVLPALVLVAAAIAAYRRATLKQTSNKKKVM